MVWEKQNTISAAENKCNASFCRLELLPFLSHSRPQTDFPQTGAPGMELLNAPGISCLCMAIGHQISNSNNDQWQRGREISTPNSLTKITWSACSTHVPLTEARPYFHFGTMFYILCQHISGSPWKGENQQVKFSCLPLPFTPSPSPSLSLPPPSTLPVCLGIIASLKADSRRDSPAVSEFLIDSTSLSKSQEVVDTERSALAMETGQSERWLWFYGLRAAWFRLREPACVSQGEGRDSSGVWDGHVHSAIFRMGSQQGPTVCYVPTWMGGESGGEWIHVHVWLSPFSVHLKLSWHSLVTGYIPI